MTSNVPLGQLANELDSKLLMSADLDTAKIRSPLILTVDDLARMRVPPALESNASRLLTLKELNAQRPRFASNPALHDYLLAAYHVYVDHQPAQALALLAQPSAKTLDYMSLSRQMLRGFALEDSNQADKARELWARLIPLAKHRLQRETLELGAGVQSGVGRSGRSHICQRFTDSGCGDPCDPAATQRRRGCAAGPGTKRIDQPHAPRYRTLHLAYKEFTRARYADFLADLALMPNAPSESLKPFGAPNFVTEGDYGCPSARDVAAALQQNPSDPKGLNCLSEFVRLHPAANGLIDADSAPSLPASSASALSHSGTTLGSVSSPFGGTAYQRMPGYRDGHGKHARARG